MNSDVIPGLTLVVAMSLNDCIGHQGAIPWNLPQDRSRFRHLTVGHAILMGRKTWESLPERFRPLPQRTNIVISRNNNLVVPPGVQLYADLEQALSEHQSSPPIIIGGASIYQQTIARATKLHITYIQTFYPGDAFFPPLPKGTEWEVRWHERHEGFEYLDLVRTK